MSFNSYRSSRSSGWKQGREGGGRGGRGGRGGMKGYHQERPEDADDNEGASFRHPRGLKGKEIGLWYARQNRPPKNMTPEETAEWQSGKANRQKRREERQETRTRIGVDLTSFQKTLVRDALSAFAGSNENPSPRVAFAPKTFVDEDSWFSRRPLERDAALDSRLKADLERMEKSSSYEDFLDFRRRLPVFEKRDEVMQIVDSDSRVCVVSGATGSGKTTQIPQFILDEALRRGDGSVTKVVCTQPRRISAISIAERVAAERGESFPTGNKNKKRVEGSVGYQIRLTSVIPRHEGSILYCTTGVVLKWLESDPDLRCVSHLVLDEVHERDLQTDFLIICLRELLQRCDHLKLVLMSATLDAQLFSSYFNDCPTIDVPGRLFPVERILLEDIVESLNYVPQRRDGRRSFQQLAQSHGGGAEGKSRARNELSRRQRLKEGFWERKSRAEQGRYSRATMETMKEWSDDIDYELIHLIVCHVIREREPGSILIFLPGWGEISKCKSILEGSTVIDPSRTWIIPLHSMMPTSFQREIFSPSPTGKTKIVISTNIAETSVTIEDVVYVIDSGLLKATSYDPDASVSILAPEFVSKANARQRAGRAGRVRPGFCFHLFSSFTEESLSEYLKPEMLRTPLESVCLQIKVLRRGDAFSFLSQALNPPSPAVVKRAVKNLRRMNALDDEEGITTLGYHLARMNVDPHAGKMILYGALFRCLDPVLTIAASLGYRDAFVTPLGKEKEVDDARCRLACGSISDHVMLYNAFTGWDSIPQRAAKADYVWNNFLAPSILNMLKDMKRDFAENLCAAGFLESSDMGDPRANQNSANVNLVKAIVCAGLYPQVARLGKKNYERRSKAPRKAIVVTDAAENRRVAFLHMKSSLTKVERFKSPWIVYHQLMITSKSYIFDATMVSHFPLLFFGGKIEKRVESGGEVVVVDEWIKFWARHSIADDFVRLRSALDEILARKIDSPRLVSWSREESALVDAIVAIIASDSTLNDLMDETFSGDE